MRNKNFFIISLSKFTKWLASIAEELGVNIFPGFAASSFFTISYARVFAGLKLITPEADIFQSAKLLLIFK